MLEKKLFAKKLRTLFLYSFFPLVLIMTGCEFHDGYYDPYYDPYYDDVPTQSEVNTANSSVDSFLLNEVALVDDYLADIGISNCLTLHDAFAAIEGTFECDQGGTFSMAFVDFQCDDIGPIHADVTLDYDFVNCRDTMHGIREGSLGVFMGWSTTNIDFLLDSGSIFIDGLDVEFANTGYAYDNAVYDCSGTTYYNDYACDWNPDCTCYIDAYYKTSEDAEATKKEVLIKRNM